MSALFGGSHSNSSSSNQAYPYLQGALGGTVGQGTQALGQVGQLLGVGGNAGDAFNNYLNSTGYNFQLGQGSQAITGNAAAKGLLNSGSTLKALNNYGQNMGQNYFNNYLQQLSGLGTAGLQGAGVIGSAGNTSSQSSKSKNGVFQSL